MARSPAHSCCSSRIVVPWHKGSPGSCLPDQVIVYGDCAINPEPNAEDLADIAIQTAASARAFGIEPRVAMISFSTGTSGTGSEVDKVAAATGRGRL
jgi:phosphate acetyltransferase